MSTEFWSNAISLLSDLCCNVIPTVGRNLFVAATSPREIPRLQLGMTLLIACLRSPNHETPSSRSLDSVRPQKNPVQTAAPDRPHALVADRHLFQ